MNRRFSFEAFDIAEIEVQLSEQIEVRSFEAVLLFSLKKNLEILTRTERVCFESSSFCNVSPIFEKTEVECLAMKRKVTGSNEAERFSERMSRTMRSASVSTEVRLRIAS